MLGKRVELDPTLAEDFITESEEYLDNIDQKLLDLESQLSDKECVNDIFRAIHTIKGLSGFLDLELISELSHKLETLLDEIRKEKREATSDVIDVLFQGVDLLRKLIDDVKHVLESDTYVYEPTEDRIAEVESLLNSIYHILQTNAAPSRHDVGAAHDNERHADAKSSPMDHQEERETMAEAKHHEEPAKTADESQPKQDQQTTPAVNEPNSTGFQIPEKLYKDFQIEALDHLEICDQALITLDKQRNNLEAVNNLFRSIHTIKGSSSYLGLKSIAAFSHGLEELLELIRRKEAFHLADEFMDILFESVDCLKGLVESPQDPDRLKNSQQLLETIIEHKNRLQQDTGTDLLEAAPKVQKNSPEAIFLQTARQFVESFKVGIEKLKSEGTEDAKALTILERAIQSLKSSATYMGYSDLLNTVELSEKTLQALQKGEIPSPAGAIDFLEDQLKEITYFLNEVERNLDVPEPPSVAESEPPQSEASAGEDTIPPEQDQPAAIAEEKTNKEQAKKGSHSSEPEHQKPTASEPQRQTPASVSPSKPAPSANGSDGEKKPASGPKTMRIDQRLLDVFMNLVGELIVTRNAFGHVIRHLENHAEDRDKAMKDLRAASQSITRISEEMQRVVMDMRMVPMRNVFQKFPRMVRDLTRKTSKTVDLIIQGEETEIDKGIAEVIGDPLIHIIRNAVDHGIEPPDVRREAGKPEKGTIILRAAHEGNYIVIEVIDDGKGLDPDLLLKKAIEKGLTTPEKAKHLSKEDIYNFIFMPGFSTAKQVTDISGRGVGMDVVRTNLRKLKGNIRVSSEVGQGTHVRLEVPLTLAIIEALLVGVGEDIFAIPIEAVTETVKLKRDQLHSLMTKKAFSLRGEVICVEFLSHLLNLSFQDSQTLNQRDEIPVLIIQAGGERLGLAVDEMYRQEEIVVKPLADYLADLPGLAGASIFGDGKAILILDPEELVSMATERLAA